MAKRFEKKETDKSEIEREEKRIGIGKIVAGIGTFLLGTAVFIITKGEYGGTTKS